MGRRISQQLWRFAVESGLGNRQHTELVTHFAETEKDAVAWLTHRFQNHDQVTITPLSLDSRKRAMNRAYQTILEK